MEQTAPPERVSPDSHREGTASQYTAAYRIKLWWWRLARYRWLPYVAPLALFMLLTGLEPTAETPGGRLLGMTIAYHAYPVVYSLKLLVVTAAMAASVSTYRRFPFRVTWLGAAVGLGGGCLWIGLTALEFEASLLPALGLGWLVESGARSGFNPFVELAGRPLAAWGFLGIRLLGLVLIVPVIEEFFLRGFVMRFVVAERWWRVPFGRVTVAAAIAGTAIPVLAHPGEMVAAAVWFSLVTWLMVRTRSLWDCVLAHALTNAVLGAYVLASAQWHLV